MHLIVNEIFRSIQGESTYCGLGCTFVRLTGCNLRCSYCDTKHAYDEGTRMSGAEILSVVRSMGTDLVLVTGGEPLLQAECPALLRELVRNGATVLVETNGSLDIRCLPDEAICILDMKCPSSGMSDRMLLRNLDCLRLQDQVKFVIGTREDYDWAGPWVKKLSASVRPERILFSPVYRKMDPRELAEWMLSDRMAARLQVPLHTLLWPHGPRGR